MQDSPHVNQNSFIPNSFYPPYYAQKFYEYDIKLNTINEKLNSLINIVKQNIDKNSNEELVDKNKKKENIENIKSILNENQIEKNENRKIMNNKIINQINDIYKNKICQNKLFKKFTYNKDYFKYYPYYNPIIHNFHKVEDKNKEKDLKNKKEVNNEKKNTIENSKNDPELKTPHKNSQIKYGMIESNSILYYYFPNSEPPINKKISLSPPKDKINKISLIINNNNNAIGNENNNKDDKDFENNNSIIKNSSFVNSEEKQHIEIKNKKIKKLNFNLENENINLINKNGIFNKRENNETNENNKNDNSNFNDINTDEKNKNTEGNKKGKKKIVVYL